MDSDEKLGYIGMEGGMVCLGKLCSVCGRYYVHYIPRDDYSETEHKNTKDDFCLECLVNNVLTPALERATKENKLKDRIIEEQTEVIKLQEERARLLQKKIDMLIETLKLMGAHGFDGVKKPTDASG